ncbi:MAG: 2-polyprenyl-3-methyl-6-methoxy-1,4-benzoquinone monooxygenase [Proteobacteria bacterium]|nr:2-polyprenyl-3-methyl-6-methoxy-1,4-benzoquinone monooxygenase [Pseudomonadota bacterium]
MLTNNLSLIDRVVCDVDQGLRTLFAHNHAARCIPSDGIPDPIEESDKALSASLMRVNHAGEVCAQALYQGQGLASKTTHVKDKMQQAADEEIDHLAWCRQRVEELGGRTSRLDPLWYIGSLGMGLIAGFAGDRWSLGFLAETERQVVAHLQSHLERLPENDTHSRAIIEQMIEDEANHATMAMNQGASELPIPLKKLMRSTAKVMTSIAERI